MTIKRNAMGAGTPPNQAGSTIGGLANNITATGSSSQAGSALLSVTSNNVVTVGGANTGVILPPGNGTGDALAPGDWIRVANYVSGNAILVYPPVGGKIQNGTLNASFSVGALKTAEFVCIDGLNFFANLSS